MRGQTGFFIGVLSGLMVLSLAMPCFLSQAGAEPLQLLRTLEIAPTAYQKEATQLPETLTDTKQAVALLEGSRNVAFHMAVIRQAYDDFPPAQREGFLEALHARHREMNEDTYRFFDHGYAQFMFNSPKTALYFLRKANDRLKNQFASVAYAIAQAEVDLNEEAASPEELTLRKQDVIYKLTDAVNRDAEAHLKGFWPTYLNVLSGLSSVPAYQAHINSDVTTSYVPYGTMVMPDSGVQNEEEDEEGADHRAVEEPNGGCALAEPESLDFTKLYRSLSVELTGDTVPEAIHFFTTEQADWYRVVVLNRQNKVLADLNSPVAPYIAEDLDHDGVAELVVRQFKHEKTHPVQVYRFNDCQFEPDPDVTAYFE